MTIELFRRAASHADRVAFAGGACPTRYADLLRQSARVAGALLGGAADLHDERIAFAVPASAEHGFVQWGIWRAGGIAVPLNLAAAAPEIEHVLRTAGVSRVVTAGAEASTALLAACKAANVSPLALDELLQHEVPAALPDLVAERPAMLVFTSGTTGKPKAALYRHATIEAQVRALAEAWGWQADDRIPLFLPLHHVHGIVNVMCCALWSGASIEPYASFAVDRVLERTGMAAFTVFMAVPTIYVRLIEALQALPAQRRDTALQGFRRLRLMVSGSAALPANIHAQWKSLTGQDLLERYGMTEIGMALSNPLHGERRPGSVGRPLPGVEVRLVDEQGGVVAGEDQAGEIQVRGANVFAGYWNDPEATRNSFSADGWFLTGDIGVRERGYYRILGRQSVDIIKSGGYKLSALEIENVLLEHPAVREVAVVGLADPAWGELVGAACVLRTGATLELDELLAWCRERLSTYKLPRRLRVVEALPRNALGKVLKPAVRSLFADVATG